MHNLLIHCNVNNNTATLGVFYLMTQVDINIILSFWYEVSNKDRMIFVLIVLLNGKHIVDPV